MLKMRERVVGDRTEKIVKSGGNNEGVDLCPERFFIIRGYTFFTIVRGSVGYMERKVSGVSSKGM